MKTTICLLALVVTFFASANSYAETWGRCHTAHTSLCNYNPDPNGCVITFEKTEQVGEYTYSVSHEGPLCNRFVRGSNYHFRTGIVGVEAYYRSLQATPCMVCE